MWRAVFSLLLLFIPFQAIAAVTLSCSVTRTSGNAPLAVWVNCQNTTATGVTYPWHEVQYKVDFGDTPTTFVNGSRGSLHGDSSANDNVMYGPLAAHVYESAGTYNITVTGTDASGSTSATTEGTVTVSGFANDATAVCVSGSSTWTNCPSLANHETTSNFDTAINNAVTNGYTQIYFHSGETFTSAAAATCTPGSANVCISTAGPGIVSSYDTGAQPIVSTSSTSGTVLTANASDWRVKNIKFQGPATPPQSVDALPCSSQATFDDVTVDGFYHGWNCNPTGSQFMVWKSTVQNIVGLQNGSDSSYAGYFQQDNGNDYLAVIGSSATNTNPSETKTHLFRMESVHHVVYEDNTLTNTTGVSTWKTGSVNYTGNANQIDNWLIGSDNYVDGATSLWGVETGGNCFGCGFVEEIQDVIIERNWFVNSNEFLHVGVVRGTVRDNVYDCGTCTAGGWSMLIRHQDPTVQPLPDDIWIYNNTLYRGIDEGTNDAGAINLGDNTTGEGSLGHIWIENNIYYGPTNPNGFTIRPGASYSATLVESNNTCGVGNAGELSVTNCKSTYVTNPFTSVSPFTPTNAKPAAASYPIGAGTTVPVYGDFFLTALGGTYDIGAVTTQSAPKDHGHGSFELFNIGWMVIGIGALLGSLLTLKGGPRWAHS